MLKLKTTISNLRQATFLVGNFQNPSTTRPIAGIQSFLTNSTEWLKAAFQNTYLSNLSPERITFASLSPSSMVIGESGLTFTVSFKTKNTFKPEHQIWLTVPFWNPRSTSPRHMLASTAPNCKGLTPSLKSTLNC